MFNWFGDLNVSNVCGSKHREKNGHLMVNELSSKINSTWSLKYLQLLQLDTHKDIIDIKILYYYYSILHIRYTYL